MCGIAGQFSVKKSIINVTEVKNMLKLIQHRGPDGEGIFESGACVFGMRRLSIIDLDGGWQPIYNEDQTLVCCSNGEIYNYIELRKELEPKHKFKTNSDTEVIVHLYEEYGVSFVNKLNGMFAIALFDQKTDRLLIYRDRLGKKPLYYCHSGNKFYFASEIKCILACEGIKPKCNFKALDYILSYNYLPTNMTSFEGISKLMPGEYLSIDKNSFNTYKYWDLPAFDTSMKGYSENDVIEYVDSLLGNAISIRLRSDVPVGAYLSGGVDSSLVVAKTSSIVNRLKTFSIGFNEKSFDESIYSQKVAGLYYTDHTNQIVEDDFFSLIPKTIWLNDNPHGDVSFLPSYVLAEIAARRVKTVLTGDGGDELFGGYDKYLGYINDGMPSMRDFFERNSVFSVNQKKLLYTEHAKNKIEAYNENCLNFVENLEKEFLERSPGIDRLNILLNLETKLLLEGNNLVKPDRMGMGNSLEARMPLLDYRLVEFVTKLPSNLKIRDGITKYLLKKVASKYLPDDIVYRKKQMFTVPIGEWFKGPLKQAAYSILMDKRTVQRNIFNVDYVKFMLDQHTSGMDNFTRQLRLLIIIELWHRIFIDSNENHYLNLSNII